MPELNSRVKSAAFGHHAAGLKPPDILTALELKFGGETLPKLRTIQSWTASPEWRREVKVKDLWGIGDARGDDGSIVLETLAGVVEETRGAVRSFSRAEADWIVRLARGDDTLTPWQRYVFARLYIGRQAAGQGTNDLDLNLAFAPWRDGWKRLERALFNGWLPPGEYGGPYPGRPIDERAGGPE